MKAGIPEVTALGTLDREAVTDGRTPVPTGPVELGRIEISELGTAGLVPVGRGAVAFVVGKGGLMIEGRPTVGTGGSRSVTV